jgi:ketosteroid isomerase-like protein
MAELVPDRSTEDRLRTVRRLYDAFARRRIDEILPLLAPDVEWGEPENPLNPAAGTRHGHAGFLEWVRIGADAEEILSLVPRTELTGPDAVAVVGHARLRARPTGRVYETDFVHLIEFRGAHIVRFQEFFDTYAAAEAFRLWTASAGGDHDDK